MRLSIHVADLVVRFSTGTGPGSELVASVQMLRIAATSLLAETRRPVVTLSRTRDLSHGSVAVMAVVMLCGCCDFTVELVSFGRGEPVEPERVIH